MSVAPYPAETGRPRADLQALRRSRLDVYRRSSVLLDFHNKQRRWGVPAGSSATNTDGSDCLPVGEPLLYNRLVTTAEDLLRLARETRSLAERTNAQAAKEIMLQSAEELEKLATTIGTGAWTDSARHQPAQVVFAVRAN